jgi:hypothetical protein
LQSHLQLLSRFRHRLQVLLPILLYFRLAFTSATPVTIQARTTLVLLLHTRVPRELNPGRLLRGTGVYAFSRAAPAAEKHWCRIGSFGQVSRSLMGEVRPRWAPQRPPGGSHRLPAWESTRQAAPQRPPRGSRRLPAWGSIHKVAPQRLPAVRSLRFNTLCPTRQPIRPR